MLTSVRAECLGVVTFGLFFRLLGCSNITAAGLGGYDVVNVVDLVKTREAER